MRSGEQNVDWRSKMFGMGIDSEEIEIAVSVDY